MNVNVPLSQLVASRTNPRKVKPERESHRRLVASLRAHGLLEPLVVRPDGEDLYRVIAGNRRLAALRVVHAEDDFKVPCVVRKVNAEGAEELSVAENFIREPMHPLDEAEAFARMASVDCKGVSAIAIEFGVTEGYVRQRAKLAGLCETVKDAYRSGEIDTATASAFAAVPVAKQEEVWKAVGGKPRHAQQVKNLIEEQWIDASHALFPVDSLPEGSVTSDLFQERVLVERGVFMQAQAQALSAEKQKLMEDGWSEVVLAEHGDTRHRLYSMTEPDAEFTEAERVRMDELDVKQMELEEAGQDDEEPSPDLAAVYEEQGKIVNEARGRCSEATRCRATVFLVLSPDGQVERHIRVPRVGYEMRNGHTAGGVGPGTPPPVPTSNNLSERQHAGVDAHEAVAVRHAVMGSPIVRKRLLVLALHDKVRTDAIALRHDANGTTLHAEKSESFASGTFSELRTGRDAIDPFTGQFMVEEEQAYRMLVDLPEERLDALIAALLTDCLTGHGQRATPLLATLRVELSVSIRDHWTPDAEWLSGYQRVQLAHLMETLRGAAHGSAALKRKKSELVEELAKLFEDAASGKIDDAELAWRVNTWTPAIDG